MFKFYEVCFFVKFNLREILIYVTSLAALHITEKVLAKCGLNLNESSSSDCVKPMLFHLVKINKKNNMKSSGG